MSYIKMRDKTFGGNKLKKSTKKRKLKRKRYINTRKKCVGGSGRSPTTEELQRSIQQTNEEHLERVKADEMMLAAARAARQKAAEDMKKAKEEAAKFDKDVLDSDDDGTPPPAPHEFVESPSGLEKCKKRCWSTSGGRLKRTKRRRNRRSLKALRKRRSRKTNKRRVNKRRK